MTSWYNEKKADRTGAFAKSSPINSSVYKLNMVGRLIKGEPVSSALLQLKFMNQKASKIFYDTLRSAVANADHNIALDVDQLYVKYVRVNKAFVLRRTMAKAKGRASRIRKPYSFVSIFVADKSRESSKLSSIQ